MVTFSPQRNHKTQNPQTPINTNIVSRRISSLQPPINLKPHRTQHPSLDFPGKYQFFASYDSAVRELLKDVELGKQREREQRKRADLDLEDIDAEDEEDYLGVGSLLEKLEKEKLKEPNDLMRQEEATDSDTDDNERNSSAEVENRATMLEKKFKRHRDLLQKFTDSENLDDAHKWMTRLNKFEEKHLLVGPEYRVIGELLNRLQMAGGKDKFLIQQKFNRAMRMAEWKEAFDPNNPANYGLIQREQQSSDFVESSAFEKENLSLDGSGEDADMEFDDMKERDDILIEKLNAIDKVLEAKLADLDHTFGRRGKALEEEIKDFAEERNALTEKKRRPMYRKGFDVKLIDINRTCKVTKGGQVVKYSAKLVCGNYQGGVGFAKAKGPGVPFALQKAHEKCFQNLHYVERHEEHTIAHAIESEYKKTKVCLWPASTRSGMSAGKTVQTILSLAGFKNVKSKVIGSRNPYYTVKAVFQALNKIETRKDAEEKFGRTDCNDPGFPKASHLKISMFQKLLFDKPNISI